MLHARHLSNVHAEASRFELWLRVAGVLASMLAMLVARACRRG